MSNTRDVRGARLDLGVVFRPQVSGLVVEAGRFERLYDSFGVITAGVDANHVLTPVDEWNIDVLYPAIALDGTPRSRVRE